jgi:hypothetical protein
MWTFVTHPLFLAPGSKEKNTTMPARRKLVHVRLSELEYRRLVIAAEAALTRPATLLRDLAFTSLGAPAPVPEALDSVSLGLLTTHVSSRFTAAEAESLAERARECGLPVSAYVRSVLRGATPSPRRAEARAAVVALSRVGNNLNQLTRLAHGGTLLSGELFRAIDALRIEVYRVRAEILSVIGGRP